MEFDTLVGRLSLQRSQVVIAYSFYGAYFFPIYAARVITVTEEREGIPLLLNVPELNSLESMLSRNDQWDILNPPPLIEQIVINDISRIGLYDEALALIQKPDAEAEKALEALLDFAEREGSLWGLKSKYASGQLTSDDRTGAAKVIYEKLLKPKGAARRTQHEIEKLLNGNTVKSETINLLAEWDERFYNMDIEGSKEYVRFVQRGIARMLVANEGAESDNMIEYMGETLSEKTLSVVRREFIRLSGNYGAAFVGDSKEHRQLYPVYAVEFTGRDSLPEEIKSKFKPLERVVEEMLILMQVMYTSILRYAKENYGQNAEQITLRTMAATMPRERNFKPQEYWQNPDIIALEAEQGVIPRERYFSQLYSKGKSLNNLSWRNEDEVMSGVGAIIHHINKKEVPAVYPVSGITAPLLFLSYMAGMLVSYLPNEMLEAMAIKDYMASKLIPAAMSRRENKTQELRKPLQDRLKMLGRILANEFGVDIAWIPNYGQQFNRRTVIDTLNTYSGEHKSAENLRIF